MTRPGYAAFSTPPAMPTDAACYAGVMCQRALLATTAVAGLCLGVPAQTGPDNGANLPPLGQPAPIPEDAPPHLARIDRSDLQSHTYWLADDERQGRYTSSAGQQATVDYIADHFEKLGLKPLGDKRGYVQRYPLAATYIDKSTQLRLR